MLANTAFSFASASLPQTIAFVGSIVAIVGFFGWIIYLVRMRPHH